VKQAKSSSLETLAAGFARAPAIGLPHRCCIEAVRLLEEMAADAGRRPLGRDLGRPMRLRPARWHCSADIPEMKCWTLP
jgi:hypothetical protein